MKVSPNMVVTLTYELKNKEGEVIDTATEDAPFAFIHSIGHTLPAFDENLLGLGMGDAFSFTLAPEDGYGEVNEEYVIELPRQSFEGAPDGLLALGNMVPLQDTHGNQFQGVIQKISDEVVVVDLNHPLAGVTLFFSGKIMEVRAASKDELEHGHVHGAHGFEH